MSSSELTALSSSLILGIDFDNTIINYDQLMYDLALQKSFISPDTPKIKKEIRDCIRKLANGDLKWQEIQAEAYGLGITKATFNPGVKELFIACHQLHIPCYIISHKTKYSNLVQSGQNFQEAALHWMHQHHFFDDKLMGLTTPQVYFEPTREQKIARIQHLNCTHFIDDLEETFQDVSFPNTIKKIQFDPHAGKEILSLAAVKPSTWIIASSFKAITQIITQDYQNKITEQDIQKISQKLLHKEIINISPLEGGRNNKVYCLQTAGTMYFAKLYYSNPLDMRNRLKTEFFALSYLWKKGIHSIPRPIAQDPKKNVAIYEFIQGTKIIKGAATEGDIDAAVLFLTKINSFVGQSAEFQNASDACFCMQDYIDIIHRRLGHLQKIPNTTVLENSLHRFLQDQYVIHFNEVLRYVQDELRARGKKMDTPITTRILSPSDFGFHNALRTADSSLTFFDFEYFGRDDPAKTVSDFILHPGMELPEHLKARFATKILAEFRNEELNQRISLVFPLVGLIWCLIILNEFVPQHQTRRDFANTLFNEQQKNQLYKAQQLFSYLQKHDFREFIQLG